MNSYKCINCPDSPWVRNAESFISDPNNPKEQVETVKFLLERGHCGINNRTRIEDILNYLESCCGIKLSREQFQNKVLTELKRKGIVASLVYPGHHGGIFIPCNESEIQEVAKQVFDRVWQELRNLESITEGTSIKNLVSSLKGIVEFLKNYI